MGDPQRMASGAGEWAMPPHHIRMARIAVFALLVCFWIPIIGTIVEWLK